MTEQLYRRYDVDEETPVQFVGVYTTHWRSEWGEPEAMFAQVDDPLIDTAPQLLEAASVGLSLVEAQIEYRERMGYAVAEDTLEIRNELRAAIAATTGASDE